jgi:hypothetical protein
MTAVTPPNSRSGSVLVTEDQKRQYREEGFFVLPGVIEPGHLELLRGEAQWVVEHFDNQSGGTHAGRERRYVYEHTWRDRPSLRRFLFGELMAEICRATIGPDANLFYEQFLIKAAENGKGLSWHQDSGYIGPNHKPYVTCWCALDDMSEENGTVRILPTSVSGIRTFVKHERDPVNGDLVGYFGRERGIPVIAPAGSIAVFSSYTFHTSGANTTPRLRRAYLAQYAPEPVLNAKGDPCGTAEPFLKGGRTVAKGP